MEYAHGGALNQLLQRRQSGLYPNVFIQYAKQIADGMKYLHEEACEHIIHRDLKCSNILILERIGDIHNDQDLLQKTLKITDFGLAKKQLQSTRMSAAGTFAWMSPECIRNSEFSTKSDVWSFGVLLWDCLTGELPYNGFDQMQVAFGIATNKYSLPLPSTCPEEFSQLMTNCWKILPHERPTFSDLLEQINRIIEINSTNNEEAYQSLQNDWRQEIQDMFNELKEKEQEIRDREQAMYQRSLEQNHQRIELEKWEQQLYEREMHIVELELSLLMAKNNQERAHNQTPKIQKRSGRFMRSLLNGNTNLSSPINTLISSPTNFRHLISVCHNHPGFDHTSSPTIPTSSSSPISCPIPPNSSNKSPYNRSYSSSSTPTTPNMSRLRTLTSSGDLIINNYISDESLPIPDGKK
jgi:mitogen-activated protein kinase kinase kinase 9